MPIVSMSKSTSTNSDKEHVKEERKTERETRANQRQHQSLQNLVKPFMDNPYIARELSALHLYPSGKKYKRPCRHHLIIIIISLRPELF